MILFVYLIRLHVTLIRIWKWTHFDVKFILTPPSIIEVNMVSIIYNQQWTISYLISATSDSALKIHFYQQSWSKVRQWFGNERTSLRLQSTGRVPKFFDSIERHVQCDVWRENSRSQQLHSQGPRSKTKRLADSFIKCIQQIRAVASHFYKRHVLFCFSSLFNLFTYSIICFICGTFPFYVTVAVSSTFVNCNMCLPKNFETKKIIIVKSFIRFGRLH